MSSPIAFLRRPSSVFFSVSHSSSESSGTIRCNSALNWVKAIVTSSGSAVLSTSQSASTLASSISSLCLRSIAITFSATPICSARSQPRAPRGGASTLLSSIRASGVDSRNSETRISHLRDRRRACAVAVRRSLSSKVRARRFPATWCGDPILVSPAARQSSTCSDVRGCWDVRVCSGDRARTRSAAGGQCRPTPRPMSGVRRHAGCSTDNTSSSAAPVGKLVDFVAVGMPAGPPLAREQVDIRTVAIRFDAAIKFVGLAGMLAPRSKDQFAHVLAVAPAIAAAGEQNDFGLSTCGQTQTDGKIRLRQWVSGFPRAPGLEPGECTGRKFETPCFDQFKRLRQKRPAGPQEQMAAFGRCELLDRQRGERGKIHHLIVPLVAANAAWILRLDRRVALELRRHIDRDRAVIATPQPDKGRGGG